MKSIKLEAAWSALEQLKQTQKEIVKLKNIFREQLSDFEDVVGTLEDGSVTMGVGIRECQDGLDELSKLL